MGQPKHKTCWFLDTGSTARRYEPAGPRGGVTGRDLIVQGTEPQANTTNHQPTSPEITTKPGVVIGGQPSAFSKMIGKLLGDGSRKAVDRLHAKGITTYGWKDGQMVAVKPKKT